MKEIGIDTWIEEQKRTGQYVICRRMVTFRVVRPLIHDNNTTNSHSLRARILTRLRPFLTYQFSRYHKRILMLDKSGS